MIIKITVRLERLLAWVIGFAGWTRTYIETHRLLVAILVVVHGPRVEHHDCPLRNKFAFVSEVLRREMRSSKPEGVMTTFNLPCVST